MWCIADLTPAYVTCMEDVLALNERPYASDEPVVCLDEKPVSLHAEVRAPHPARPGHVAKRNNEYRRCGTANIFGVVEPKAGRHFTCATPNRSAAAFARMARIVVQAYPTARTFHLVLDNLNTRREKALTDAFGDREGRRLWRRLTVHYTPLAEPSRDRTEPGVPASARHPSHRRPCHPATTDSRVDGGRQPRETTINWQFTRNDARQKFNYKKPTSTRSQY